MSFRSKEDQWDWVTIMIVLLLLTIGIVNLYSAAYNPNHPFLLDFNTLYGKQMVWIGAGLFIGLVISLIDERYIRKLSPYGYMIILVFLVLVLFTNPINGARSWLGFGSFGIQPSEFGKLGLSLILAYIFDQQRENSYSNQTFFFSIFFLLLTMFLVLAENDTGTFLVYTAFFFVLYREGITFDPIILFISNTILGLKLKKTWVGTHFIPVLFVVLFLSIITVFYTDSVQFIAFLPGYPVPGWLFIMIGYTIVASICYIIIHYFASQNGKLRLKKILFLIYFISIALTGSVSYTYSNILQPHQKERIDLWLGKIHDPNGQDYNRNRALAAVGSGGLTGIGYRDAILSSPKAQHVPESKTDFIFTVWSEEWGFLGDAVLILLFTGLILRILFIAERQKSRFSRVFAYCLAILLFYHFAINIGMNIGLMPVIGIPLPFLSYGGSSLITFIVMVCIMLKLDSQRKTILAR